MGLFSNRYNKPGPGVAKNEPEKIGFIRFFELYFRNFWKLCTANLLALLTSVLVLTDGLAEAGLAYVTRAASRDKHTFVSSDFWDTIKKNWKQALPVGIINLLVTALLLFDIYFVWCYTQGFFSIIMLGLTMLCFVMFSFAKYYIYLMMITFNLKVTKIYKNAFILAIGGLGRNLLISVVLLLFYAAAFALVYFFDATGVTIAIVVYMFFFKAFRSFLIQFNVFPVIKKTIIDPYYAEHPDDDIEKRRDLGLLDDEYDDESDFSDEELLGQ